MLSKATKITTTNLTMGKTQNVDMDIKDNLINYQENSDSSKLHLILSTMKLSSLNPICQIWGLDYLEVLDDVYKYIHKCLVLHF
jgi:hypothetical protein